LETSTDLNHILYALPQAGRTDNASKGSVLVYLIVVILIFGVLGVTMVSLFTTATTSSATPNDARRAYSMAESGMRYAFSELIDNDFSEATVNDLNSTTYNVADAGSFIVNVFSPWFLSTVVGLQVTMDAQVGNIPDPNDYSVSPNAWIVNLNYNPAFPISGESAVISNIVSQTTTTLVLDLSDDFVAGPNEIVCFAVRPSNTETYPISLNQGNTLYVEPEAQSIFPKRNGAIIINRQKFAYEKRDDQPGRIGLTKLSAFSNGVFPLNIADTSTYVILSPGNYIVIAEGQSGDITQGGISGNIYDQEFNFPFDEGSLSWIFNPDPGPDKDTEVIGTGGIIAPNPADELINIGGGVADSFGGAWYSGNLSLGGNTNFCNTGRCLFRLGIRVFFTMNYTGDGDGFTFTMMNADPTDGNDITSIGGDPQGSELLAYAGDSREDPAGTTFLDNNGGRGIVPPKLAVEFDAKTNFDQTFEDEAIKNYCSGPNLRQDTRNDPLPGGAGVDRDTVQFVYWGDRSPIDIPCRPNGDLVYSTASYDDNRHAPSADPVNERDLFLTADELGITPSNNWLNDGPWAVRLEVERSLTPNLDGNFDYKLRLWMRQCAQADCNDILGTFFQDTRIKYDYSALADLPLAQDIELSQSDHDKFIRFLFGFTTATAPGDTQSALIEHFNLSFIRPNDPVITNDPDWPPP
jgi:hypothetical protein